MNRIRVLNLTSTRYGIGGVERLLLDMSDKFDPDKFEVSYCNLFCNKEGEGVFPTELTRRGLNYHHVRGNKVTDIPSMALAVRRILKEGRYDVLHLHMMKATIVGWLATRTLKIRTIVTKHYTTALIGKHPGLMQRLDLTATRSANAIIAISRFVQNDMIQAGVSREKIRVVHNGIEVDAFVSAQEQDHVRSAELLIGSVGSLTKRKGHRYLIDAFAQVSGKFKGAKLVIAGEGPELESLTAQAERLGISDKVTFTGYTSDIVSLLKNLDLYVHPATDEPFGIAVLEAMASGKCVIVSRVDGLPEIVDHGVTGVLVGSGDVSALAAEMTKALADNDLRRVMGAKARADVQERFDISKTVKGYEKVYLDVTGS